MSNSFENNSRQSSKPTFIAYAVIERPRRKPFWNPIGSAWANSDGKGFNIILNSLPIDGKLTLREPLPEDQQSQTSQPESDEDIPY